MKRRLLSILTVLALCVSMVPFGAAALEEDGTTPPGGTVQEPSESGGADNNDNKPGDSAGDGSEEEEPSVPGDASNGLDLSTLPTKDATWTTAGTGKILYSKESNTLIFETDVVVNGSIILGKEEPSEEPSKMFTIIPQGSIDINSTETDGVGLEVWGNLQMYSQEGSYGSYRVSIAGKSAAIRVHGDAYLKELVTMVRNDTGGPAVDCDGDLSIAGGEFAIYSTHNNEIGPFFGADYAFCPDAGTIEVTGNFTINNCIRVILQETYVGGSFVLIGTGDDGSQGVFNDIYCSWMRVVDGHDFTQTGNRGGFNGLIEEVYYDEQTTPVRAGFIVYGNLTPGDGETRGVSSEFATILNNELNSLVEGFKFETASTAGWEIQPGATLDLSGAEYIDLSKGYLALGGILKLPEGFDLKTLGNITVTETTSATGEIYAGDTKLIPVKFAVEMPGTPDSDQGSNTDAKDDFPIREQFLMPNSQVDEPDLTELLKTYNFDGWYIDEDYSTKWDFNNKVTESMVLYGKCTKKSTSGGSSSGSSGGSSGGSSSRPSKPTTPTTPENPTTPTTPENVTATPNATVSTDGSAASAEVTAAMGNDLVKKAVENKSEEIIISPNIDSDVSKTEVTVPASALTDIASKTDAALTVKTPVAQVTIPNEALGTLAKDGGSVTVTAEKTDNGYQLSVTANGQTVDSVSGGVTMTVPHEGCVPGTVAVLVKEDGTREIIRKSLAGEDIVTVPLDGSARIELVDNSKSFQDVTDSSWEKDAVDFVSSRELFNGTSEDTFAPGTSMTRGMVAQVLHNLEGNPAQSISGVFTDVDGNVWYAEAVSWAADKGIVSGYGDGQFGAGDSVSRQDLAVILFRYSGSPDSTTQTLNFTDAGEISDYAKQALSWAVEEGILNGKGNGVLDPKGQATRAQVAQMLLNYMSAVQ